MTSPEIEHLNNPPNRKFNHNSNKINELKKK